MAKAIGETERRREKQQKYNEEYGITPQGLNKKVVDILALGQNIAKTKAKGRGKSRPIVEPDNVPMDMSPKALQQKIHELEGLMMQHAQNLEFEDLAIGSVESGRITRSLPLLSTDLNIDCWSIPLHSIEKIS